MQSTKIYILAKKNHLNKPIPLTKLATFFNSVKNRIESSQTFYDKVDSLVDVTFVLQHWQVGIPKGLSKHISLKISKTIGFKR